MSRFAVFVLGAVAAALAASAGLAAAETRAPVFPTVRAESLERQPYELPKGLDGRFNVVVIAYRRPQQADVDTWMPYLNALEARDPRVRWWELPTISETTGLFIGWWIDGGMRAGIPDRAQRARTITLYLDKARFRASLRLPDSDATIHTLLIDKEGRVLWRFDGPFTAAAGAALDARLKSLR
jgi:hypothetical protein